MLFLLLLPPLNENEDSRRSFSRKRAKSFPEEKDLPEILEDMDIMLPNSSNNLRPEAQEFRLRIVFIASWSDGMLPFGSNRAKAWRLMAEEHDPALRTLFKGLRADESGWVQLVVLCP